MATRSTISIVKNNTVKTIYCHWDGYFSHNGKILLENYNTFEKVEELISLGGLSYLDEKIHSTTDTHNFDTPEIGVCVFYHRDRGEDLDFSESEFTTIENWAKVQEKYGEDYNYIFNDGKWYWATSYRFGELTPEHCK